MSKLLVGLVVAFIFTLQCDAQKPIWTYDPDLLATGEVEKYRLGTQAFWFKRVDGTYDKSYVDMPTVYQRIEMHKNDAPNLLIDIEAFSFRGVTDLDFALQQLIKPANAWHQETDVTIGFYDIWYRSYWMPITFNSEYLSKMAKWQRENDRIATALTPHIDYVCFSVYAMYSQGPNIESQWRQYANANLNEMLRLYPDTQRHAIIQPNFPNGSPIPLHRWKGMVDFVQEHPAVDVIQVFTRRNFPGAPGWRSVLVSGVD